MPADRSMAELERFLAERADHLLGTAVLLTGTREAPPPFGQMVFIIQNGPW